LHVPTKALEQSMILNMYHRKRVQYRLRVTCDGGNETNGSANAMNDGLEEEISRHTPNLLEILTYHISVLLGVGKKRTLAPKAKA